MNVTFGSIQPVTGCAWLLASSTLTDSLFNERLTALSATVLGTYDNRTASLLDAGAATGVTGRPVAPTAQHTIHRSCVRHKC